MESRDGPTFTVRRLRADAREISRVRGHIVQILEDDLKYGYVPEWHWDLDDLRGVYVEDPRHVMLVAVDDRSDELLGTIAIQSGGPKSPPHPASVAAQYQPPERVAQVLRAYVAAKHRRRGVGAALVEALRKAVDDIGGYDVIYLHTDPVHFSGGVDFWQSMPTRFIYDGRCDEATKAVHFELAFPDGTFWHTDR